jgi:hypothetical protein
VTERTRPGAPRAPEPFDRILATNCPPDALIEDLPAA